MKKLHIIGAAFVCAIFVACGISERRYEVPAIIAYHEGNTMYAETDTGCVYTFDAEGMGDGSLIILHMDNMGTHSDPTDDEVLDVTIRKE